MSNPFRSVKSLPWTALFQSAGVTLLISVLIELVIVQFVNVFGTLASAESVRGLFSIFLFVLPILVAFGLGALALGVAARLQKILLSKDTMWALLLCVIVLLPLKNLLLLYSFSPRLDIVPICLVAAGLFTAGRRYWR